MKAYDASYWDDSFKPKKPTRPLPKEENNKRIKDSAEIHAWEMKNKPSFLEKMMMGFLDRNHIMYEFQKIFYIAGKNKYITQYFIADFYVPQRRTIVEVDGKFHKEQTKQDQIRTQLIKKHYKRTFVVRVTYNDFKNPKKLEDLVKRLK